MKKNTVIITHMPENQITQNNNLDYFYQPNGVKTGYYYTKQGITELTQNKQLLESALKDIENQLNEIENYNCKKELKLIITNKSDNKYDADNHHYIYGINDDNIGYYNDGKFSEYYKKAISLLEETLKEMKEWHLPNSLRHK